MSRVTAMHLDHLLATTVVSHCLTLTDDDWTRLSRINKLFRAVWNELRLAVLKYQVRLYTPYHEVLRSAMKLAIEDCTCWNITEATPQWKKCPVLPDDWYNFCSETKVHAVACPRTRPQGKDETYEEYLAYRVQYLQFTITLLCQRSTEMFLDVFWTRNKERMCPIHKAWASMCNMSKSDYQSELDNACRLVKPLAELRNGMPVTDLCVLSDKFTNDEKLSSFLGHILYHWVERKDRPGLEDFGPLPSDDAMAFLEEADALQMAMPLLPVYGPTRLLEMFDGRWRCV